MKIIPLNLVLLAGLTMASACVSKSKYSKLEKDLESANAERTRTELELQALEQNLQSTDAERRNLAEQKATQSRLIAALQQEIKAGDVKVSRLRDRLKVELVDRILFDSGKTEIKPQGHKTLDKVADILKETTDKKILVTGYTDDVPIGPNLAEKYKTNWELSTARATSVVRHLAEMKVAEDKLAAAGRSKFDPIAPNNSPQGRQQNRRIEILLVPEEIASPRN